MRKKLWFKIFVRIAAIFAVFVLVLTASNRLFLVRFFESTEKRYLRDQCAAVCRLDLQNSNEVIEKLSDIRDKYNFETEIYTPGGAILYTSYANQMLDFYYRGDHMLSMLHKPLDVTEREQRGDGVYETATDGYTGTEYLIYRRTEDDATVELRLQTNLLRTSAGTANIFITVIACVCLFIALIVTFFSAKRISRPISEMREITRDMAKLNFERRVAVTDGDEIGELASSINDLSDRLSTALGELREKNEELLGEIELERRLDVMRKGFVANVSHELKTPISIIQGYAEGLKMNINSDARDAYCDTIIDESARMNRLVLGLLQLSKYESGQPVEKERFDLSQTARRQLERILPDVRTVPPEDGVFALADQTQTEQIFKSILENARAHVNEGGEVKISFIREGEDIKVEIHNTGSHIDEEIMPEIWQSFYRGDKSHKRDESRFGLGLSIVSAICRAQGGSCGVYNTDTGVCFWFTVKAAE